MGELEESQPEESAPEESEAEDSESPSEEDEAAEREAPVPSADQEQSTDERAEWASYLVAITENVPTTAEGLAEHLGGEFDDDTVNCSEAPSENGDRTLCSTRMDDVDYEVLQVNGRDGAPVLLVRKEGTLPEDLVSIADGEDAVTLVLPAESVLSDESGMLSDDGLVEPLNSALADEFGEGYEVFECEGEVSEDTAADAPATCSARLQESPVTSRVVTARQARSSIVVISFSSVEDPGEVGG